MENRSYDRFILKKQVTGISSSAKSITQCGSSLCIQLIKNSI